MVVIHRKILRLLEYELKYISMDKQTRKENKSGAKAAAQNIFESVRKRDGRVVSFDQNRITRAIYRAMQAIGEGDISKDPTFISDKVMKSLLKKFPVIYTPNIEEIQDAVEETLILSDFPKTAKAYILYRQQRFQVREKRKMIPEKVTKLAEESKKYFRSSLSEFVYYRSYSRWIEEEGRRETWIESVDRYINFMKENLGEALKAEEYEEIRGAVLRQEVMPSMRLLWGAGRAARKTNVSAYNCSFIAPTRLQDLPEIMYLSMCGTGVGFSVESQNVQRLPIIKLQQNSRKKKVPVHVIEDSKEGWCDALKLGLKTWYNGQDVAFDYSKLRPAGAPLITMGGRSSGPDPLHALLDFTRAKILSKQGKRLSNIDVHDIICKIGEVVVSGGVRRSALISLSDLDDQEMRMAKAGQFWLNNSQRSMANNSAVYNHKPSAAQFMEEWLSLAQSGSGERGIFNRGGLKSQLPARRWKVFEKYAGKAGTNPCVTGDTLVYVADGRVHVPIKKLAEEEKDIPVFCLNNRGGVTVRYMRHPRLTGTREAVYKLTLDDGSEIKTTAGHKFRLKSGIYKEVRELKHGDSLNILTKFEASIKDIFPQANSRSQDYWWINNGKGNNIAEHRAIAEFYFNTKISRGYVVHHQDRNAQNNFPGNLEILSKEEHGNLHGELMSGDNNPMHRANTEWDFKKWAEYRSKHSVNNTGDKNKNFSGVTNELLKKHALVLTLELGRRFSNQDWANYAKRQSLPQYFSKWRRDHLGGVLGLAKWAATELGIEHVDADPRVINSYRKYTAEGYDCEIISGNVAILKTCEVCGEKFETDIGGRECGVCSISCGLKRKWQEDSFRLETVRRINEAHGCRKAGLREKQSKVYTDLKFELDREPLKSEWVMACKKQDLSYEIARTSSPFRTYIELQDFAETYNHRVVSVEFCGYEDVYNGTVDEFHNFFVGGFSSKTRNGKRKFVYLNNLQCGEILLRSKQFCNLSEVVSRTEDTEEALLKKIRIATILGTYQSTLTHFPYLSKDWKKNCEEERLLGVSVTGQWDCPAARNPDILEKLKKYAVEVNKNYAKRMGINQSTCITCVKPSGTVSQLVDAASGMHPRHAPYYIRRIRISATDRLFHMMKDQKFPYHPEVGQAEGSANTYVLEFPVKAPKGAVFKNDLTAIQQLEHWKIVKEKYTEHNPSVTISVGEGEWIEVSNWLYKNWEILGGLSFLPRSDFVYQLAPYEEVDEKRYNELLAKMPAIDFSQIIAYEEEDVTEGAKELACVSGVCEVDFSTEIQKDTKTEISVET